MLKRVLPIALVIVLLFSSVAFAGGQGTGKASPPKGEPKVAAQMGAGFDEERMPGYPCDEEEWTPFTYCYGYGYGYGYAYNYNDCCTDGCCVYDCCTDGCCEFFYQHQHRWLCNWPELPDEPIVLEP